MAEKPVHVERVHVAHLEGAVATGRARRVWWEDCGVPGMLRIYAELEEGRVVATKCIDSRGARKVIAYTAFAKRLAPLLVLDVEVDKEEVFVPEEQG